MAVKNTRKQWILGYLLVVLLLVLAEWLEYHFHKLGEYPAKSNTINLHSDL